MDFGGLQFKNEQTLFCDDHFKRQKYNCAEIPGAELLVDDCRGGQVLFCFFSFPVTAASRVLLFEGVEKIAVENGCVLVIPDREDMVWLPSNPVVRQYEAPGVITGEDAGVFLFEETGNSLRVSWDVSPVSAGRLEFSAMIFHGCCDNILCQIQNMQDDKQVKSSVADYFKYSGMEYFWASIIEGIIYRLSDPSSKIKRFPCEQNALYLYFCFCGLKDYTGKSVYAVLSEYVAYCVLLRLSDDGRWRHGCWTQIQETHTRMQLDGIHLLCDFYARSGREVFCQKAVMAMDVLVNMAIPLRKGIWFLHDDLEVSEDKRRLYYNRLVETTAFGKTISCTLCLNTHLYTLTVLSQLRKIMPQDKYRRDYESGMDGLVDVLSSRPAQWLYGVIYGLRDIFLNYHNRSLGRKLQWKYDFWLAHRILPYLKKIFPRLVMPNGFIERDLCVLPISDVYHMVNMLDLLLLYRISGDDRIRPTIERGMAYTFSPTFLRYTLESANSGKPFLAEVLWLYICIVDTAWLDKMTELLIQFRRLRITLSPWIQGSLFLRQDGLVLKSENDDVTVLISPRNGRFEAAIFNLSDVPQRTRVLFVKNDVPGKMVWQGKGGRESLADAELELPPRGSMILVKK